MTFNGYRGAGEAPEAQQARARRKVMKYAGSLGLPVPTTCPPGIARGRWRRWDPERQRGALRNYWASLPEATQKALDQKYGNYFRRRK